MFLLYWSNILCNNIGHIYSYSSTILAFVKACILKSVFEASLCPVRVGAISFFPLYCCTFLFPCIFILFLFFCNVHNLAKKMMSFYRRFTGGIPVAVCFVMCIALGAAGSVFTIPSFQKLRHCIDFSLAGYFPVSGFARCEFWKQWWNLKLQKCIIL